MLGAALFDIGAAALGRQHHRFGRCPAAHFLYAWPGAAPLSVLPRNNAGPQRSEAVNALQQHIANLVGKPALQTDSHPMRGHAGTRSLSRRAA
jgi:hypothetical protein